MKVPWKVIVVLFFLIYTFGTLFAIYRLYSGSGHSGGFQLNREEGLNPKNGKAKNLDTEKLDLFQDHASSQEQPATHIIEIWGKAAIGLYLWKHVLNGELEESNAGLVRHGSLKLDSIQFIFRSGPGIVQTTVPSDVQYLVLILNGRSPEKVEASKFWLDYLPLYVKLVKVAVVILGNEQCNNNWLLPYMTSNGGKVDLVFLVYDSPLVDNEEFYQWPLGVAVYRGFPNILPEQVDVKSTRSYLCNFLGTVYKNSSREVLMGVVEKLHDQCIIMGRNKWLPLETEDTLNTYVKSLLKSDLTLSPVGMNTECYRIYEALSLGSVPIVEDVMTPGSCDMRSQSSPLRLLKAYSAPIIYVKDWQQLQQLINEEALMTLEQKIQRRTNVVEWYKNFKRKLANHFIQILKEKFFYNSNLSLD